MTFALMMLISFWPENSQLESWQCTNHVEIRCDSETCEAEKDGQFTPMSVSFDDDGKMSVCAYSGCWEGTGKVSNNGDFLILTGNNLSFSTAKDSEEMNENIVIALDKRDHVALLKAGSFSHPVVCKQKAR